MSGQPDTQRRVFCLRRYEQSIYVDRVSYFVFVLCILSSSSSSSLLCFIEALFRVYALRRRRCYSWVASCPPRLSVRSTLNNDDGCGEETLTLPRDILLRRTMSVYPFALYSLHWAPSLYRNASSFLLPSQLYVLCPFSRSLHPTSPFPIANSFVSFTGPRILPLQRPRPRPPQAHVRGPRILTVQC